MNKTKKIKKKIVSSWDDFEAADERLFELLLKYNIPATFYIPYNKLLLKDRLELAKKVAEHFEIGSHTISHKILPELSDRELKDEVYWSKRMIEDLLGVEVSSFCYPRGRYNDRVKEAVIKAGYKSARTVDVLNTDFPTDPFAIKPTIHAYPDRREYKGKKWQGIFLELFDKVNKGGGYFHLWGHSWEIEKYGLWEDLEKLLIYMS